MLAKQGLWMMVNVVLLRLLSGGCEGLAGDRECCHYVPDDRDGRRYIYDSTACKFYNWRVDSSRAIEKFFSFLTVPSSLRSSEESLDAPPAHPKTLPRSAAKDLARRRPRSFAALRMTGKALRMTGRTILKSAHGKSSFQTSGLGEEVLTVYVDCNRLAYMSEEKYIHEQHGELMRKRELYTRIH